VVVETRGLAKFYGPLAAVSELNLVVPDGRISAFLGPNGSGKTTTIKMLMGLVRPSVGEAFVFGKSVSDDLASAEIRRLVGYVAEDKRLYSYMTVGQALDFTRPFFPKWNSETESDLIKRFALPTDRRIKALSKGMRTKLALMLALSRRPELLILDEPGEGLDPVAIEQMLESVVKAAADGATVFFSTHQIADIERVADHVFIMNRGRLAFDGCLEQLRENCRRVNLVFPGRAPAEEMSVAGVRKLWADGHRLSLLTEGNLEAITGKASSLGALSIDVQSVNLREWFLESVGAEESRRDLV
jgi:ABC-2 type transport system ATP-binding protein